METKLKASDDWNLCSYEAEVTKPIWPHVVQCSNPASPSNYVKISSGDVSYLPMYEVKLQGYHGEWFVGSFLVFFLTSNEV